MKTRFSLPLAIASFLLLLYNFSQAQNNQQASSDSLKAQKLFEEAWKIKFTNPDSTIILSQEGVKISRGNLQMQLLGLRNISVAYSIKGSLDSAEYYCIKTLEIARELNNQTAIASAYQNLGIVASQKGNNKKALEYYEQIIKIAEKTGDSVLVMRNLNNMGLSYYKMGDYNNSVSHLLRGLQIAEIEKDTAAMINCFKNLSNAHYLLENYENALDYGLRTYNIATQKKDLRGIALACNTLGTIYQKKKDYERALNYFTIDLDFARQLKNKKNEATALHSIGNVLSSKKEYKKAENYFYKSLLLKKEIGDNSSIALTYNSLTELNINIGNIVKAQLALDSALYYSRTVEDKALAQDILNNQRALAQKSGDLLAALAYSDSIIAAKDSIHTSGLLKNIAELETKYKSEQKQRQIEFQEAQIINQQLKINQNNLILLIIIGISVIVFLSIGIVFYIFGKRKKQQLLLAQINERLSMEQYQALYRESQLKIIQEKITGQEAERSRIARELHDGVGGNLVALKLQLEQKMQNQNTEDMSSFFTMVTNTLEEVRTISHNLMPPKFNHVSIDHVLTLYIDDLNKSGKINFYIVFLPKKGWETIPVNLQVELYRIVQELCSNIIKYSNATKVSLQFSILENSLNMIMEDDGKSFNYSEQGIGYRNINDRLHLINGVFEKGTTEHTGNVYHIQIPLAEITV